MKGQVSARDIEALVESYDAGLLNDYGGGKVEWWQDYIRAELERSHEYYAQQFAALKAENDGLREALRIFMNAAYPVAVEINPRGHNWSEAYLDQARNIARTILRGSGEAG